MRITDWVEAFERRVPPALQESWDHTGKQCGRFDRELTGVVCALDLTREALEVAQDKGANLIVTHHPALFRGVYVLDESLEGQDVVMRAIESGIAVYASHTALDTVDGGVNDVMADRAGLVDVQPLRPRPEEDALIVHARSMMGTWGRHVSTTLAAYAAELKKAFVAESVVYYGEPKTPVETVGCLGGAGMDAVVDAKRLALDVLLTGDVRYHEAQEAVRAGVCVIDLGHYASEFPVLSRVAEWSRAIAPEVEVIVVSNGSESLRHQA